MLASLPSGAGETLVITCQYKTKRVSVTTSSVRHFWNAKTPNWISKVSHSHAIFSIVRGTVEECPATIAGADEANSTGLAKQRKGTAYVNSPASAKLTPNSFTTKGLKYETALTALYLGDFASFPLQRDSLEFNALIRFYIDTFARRCEAYLPANRVEVNLNECKTVEVTKRYGAEVSQTCVEYYKGFADPALDAARQKVGINTANRLLRGVTPADPFRNLIGNAISADAAESSARADLDSLFGMNACDSPGLKRFQENMRRFGINEAPLLLADSEVPLSKPPARSSRGFKDSNYAKLLDDLIFEDSRSWAGGQYVRGGVSDVTVTGRDSLGHPVRILAKYVVNNAGTPTSRGVTLEFLDGLPQCLYLEYSPDTCHHASSRIIAAFENGLYQE
jgi:hypothetical protein